MHTIIKSLMVKPIKEPIFSEMATTISIDDESAGPFVVIEQQGRADIGKICIDLDEWPHVKAAVDRLIEICESIGDGEGK